MSVQQEITNANIRVKNPAVKSTTPNEDEIQEMISSVKSQQNALGKEVTVSIDGIFFNDGTFVGEDQNLFFDSMSGSVQARKDFIAYLSDAQLSNKNASEALTGFLSKIPEKSAPNNGRADWFFDNRYDVFEESYNASLSNLRREIEFKKSKMPMDDIITQYMLIKASDFVTLHKIK